MGKYRRLVFLVIAASLAGCASAPGPREVAAASFKVDYRKLRYCTVVRSEAADANRAPPGTFVVDMNKPGEMLGFPLSDLITVQRGKPREARISLDLSNGNLLVAYAPMPFAAQDSASITFKTPPELGMDGSISTFDLAEGREKPNTITLSLHEDVHGHFSRSVELECAESAGR